MDDAAYVRRLSTLCEARTAEQITTAEWRTRLAELRDQRLEHRRQEQEAHP